MNSVPLFYGYNNNIPARTTSAEPALSLFFQRQLIQRAMSVFEWKVPRHWSKAYFLYSLYSFGFVGVVNTDKFGIIPQACSLQGFGVMHQPTNIVVANPLLRGIQTPRIGAECEIIRLQPDYGSVMDLVRFYGDMMAASAQTAEVNIVNSRMSYVFTAANKAAAESFKTMYNKIMAGEPSVCIDSNLLSPDGSRAWSSFEQNVGQNYIAGRIIDDLRKWEQRFDTAIGICNSNTEKKERLIVDEVNSNNQETEALASLWLDELRDCVERVNDMFNTEITVDWRKERGECGREAGRVGE